MSCKDNCCHCHEENEHNHNHGHDHCADIDACGCGCGHEKSESKLPVVAVVCGALLTALSFLPFLNETVGKTMLIAAVIICGLPTFRSALLSLKNRKINESLLLLIAVVAAMILGEFTEAAAVSVFFRIGELLEEFASGRSRKSIESLYSIVSDEANLVNEDGTTVRIDADEVEIGNRLAVMPHEIICVDGVVYSGEGTVDASAITGESLPVEVRCGDKVRSGMKNGDSVIYIEATAVKNMSSAALIASLVENAAQEKGESQRAVTKFASYYTPAIVAAAVLLAVIPSLITGNWQEWIHRSLILLVASCPCAVVLSAPLAFFSSMGACAKNGIIIKGSRFIEELAKADTAVFDKTGTLTTGELTVGRVYTADGIVEEEVLSLAAKCEHYSTHPIACAIKNRAGEQDMSNVGGFTEVAGGGVSADIGGKRILCGGGRMMKNNGIDVDFLPVTPVYVAIDGKAVAAVEICGEVRPESVSTVKKLRKLGIENFVMLTGDDSAHARKVCSECGIDSFRSGLLPQDKLEFVRKMKADGAKALYVGDGINDAPVLAGADVGVAMGLGTRTAREAADVVLTDSDFSRLADAVYQSKKTMSVLKTNIAFAIAVKAVVIILGIIGVAPMWAAVFADVGTMIIAVANAARLLKVKRY